MGTEKKKRLRKQHSRYTKPECQIIFHISQEKPTMLTNQLTDQVKFL